LPPAPQVQDPLIGKVIDGRYEILQRIGEGGMGVVYRARQVSIDRIIAIKMLNKQMASDPNWVERFYNEARACSRLQHPNTIRMFDFGQTREGTLFMTMEFLDGHSLRHAIAAGAPMAAARVLKILIQCCASLAEAHSLKIIHRDMKPDNVFLLNLAGSPDFVKVLDFSVAKLLQAGRLKTQAGVVFGTPQYMSPEQGRGIPLDARADLYGLGILAYEMLTGNVPFDDRNPMTVLQMHLTNQIPPLPDSIPLAMRNVVMRALSKDPDQRYQSAQEMMQACQQTFAQIGAQAAGMQGMQPRRPQLPAHHGPPPAAAPAPAPNPGANASAKTMMADSVDAASLGLSVGPPPAASSSAKTMMAQSLDSLGVPPAYTNPSAPSGLGGPPPMPGGGAPMGAPPMGPMGGAMGAPPMGAPMGAPPMGAPMGGAPMGAPMGMDGGTGGGPKKTMMLQDSEGIVSFTGSGSAPVSRPGGYPARPEYSQVTSNHRIDDGPSLLFWIVSLTGGVAIGVLAYLALLKIQGG